MKATTTPLNPALLSQIKEALEKEKHRLEKELKKFTKPNPHVAGDFDATFPEYGNDEDDNVQEVEQYTVNKPLEIALEKELRDVNKALQRMTNHTYGICKYCGQPIDEKRLLARSTSSACVSCKKTLTDEA